MARSSMGWIRILKADRDDDQNGLTRTLTERDLNRIVQSYDPSKREAPLVFGKPQTDDPAFGWVEKLRCTGQYLEAKFKQLPEPVENILRQGLFRSLNVALRPDYSLRHISLAGAQRPSVDGVFSIRTDGADEGIVLNFAESPIESYQEQGMEEEMQRLNERVKELERKVDIMSKAFQDNGVHIELSESWEQAEDSESFCSLTHKV